MVGDQSSHNDARRYLQPNATIKIRRNAHNVACLQLLLSFADELSRYNIDDVRCADSITYYDMEAALKSVQLVATFCAALEVALRRSISHQAKANEIEQTMNDTVTEEDVSSNSGLPASPPIQMEVPAAAAPLEVVEEIPMDEAGDNVFTCHHEVKHDPDDDLAISIRVGDRVRLEIRMEDGKGIGTNLNTGAMGSFPLTCLEPPPPAPIPTPPTSAENPFGDEEADDAVGILITEENREMEQVDASLPEVSEDSVAATETQVEEDDAHVEIPNYAQAHAPLRIAIPTNPRPDSLASSDSAPVDAVSVREQLVAEHHRPLSWESFSSMYRVPPANEHDGDDNSDATQDVPATPPPSKLAGMLSFFEGQGTAYGQPSPASLRPGAGAGSSLTRASTCAARPPPLPPKPKTRRVVSSPVVEVAASAPSPQPLSAQVIEKRKYARNIMNELLETEDSFKEGMQVLIDQFMKPLSEQYPSADSHVSESPHGNVITKVEHTSLFRNVPGLLEFSNKMSNLLRSAMQQAESSGDAALGGGAVAAVVNVFLVNVEFEEWDSYVRYMEGYPQACQTLEVCKKRQGFVDFIENCEKAKQCKRHTFGHYLNLPVQRISRYHLLLGRLRANTDEADPAFQALQTAEQYMKQIGEVVDGVKRQDEEIRRVFEVYEEMEGCPPDIISASRRRLLSSFQVEELFSGRKLHMHVFSDCLLLSTPRGGASGTCPSPTSSSHSSSSSSHWRRHKNKDKEKQKPKSLHFSARLNLLDLEVQSVGKVDGMMAGPDMEGLEVSSAGEGRVIVVRHVMGQVGVDRPMTRVRVRSAGIAAASALGSSSDLALHGNGHDAVVVLEENTMRGVMTVGGSRFVSRKSSVASGRSGRSSMDVGSRTGEDKVQELYALRVPDSERMASLLAALGLAGVQAP